MTSQNRLTIRLTFNEERSGMAQRPIPVRPSRERISKIDEKNKNQNNSIPHFLPKINYMTAGSRQRKLQRYQFTRCLNLKLIPETYLIGKITIDRKWVDFNEKQQRQEIQLNNRSRWIEDMNDLGSFINDVTEYIVVLSPVENQTLHLLFVSCPHLKHDVIYGVHTLLDYLFFDL